MPTLAERLTGGLLGLLIGDALGVPYEFHLPEAIPALAEIEFNPPAGFYRSHAAVPPGTWSDDGAQALALLASLLERDGLDLKDFGQRLVAWYRDGDMAVDGVVFDVGIQTSKALQTIMNGTPAAKAGSRDEYANGNGSLMRVLPLALWHQGSDRQLVDLAHQQSLPTHGHPRSQVCCALYCLWARYLLQETGQPWPSAVAKLRTIYPQGSAEREELEAKVQPDSQPAGGGSGYVVDCLHSARWAVQAGDYEAVVKAAVSLGHDTDTTACVAGGIAGIRDGVQAIPQRWQAQLRGQEIVQPLLERLLQRYKMD